MPASIPGNDHSRGRFSAGVRGDVHNQETEPEGDCDWPEGSKRQEVTVINSGGSSYGEGRIQWK
jgi:hypothetical protein